MIWCIVHLQIVANAIIAFAAILTLLLEFVKRGRKEQSKNLYNPGAAAKTDKKERRKHYEERRGKKADTLGGGRSKAPGDSLRAYGGQKGNPLTEHVGAANSRPYKV